MDTESGSQSLEIPSGQYDSSIGEWTCHFNTKNARLVFEDLNHHEFPMQGSWGCGFSYPLVIEVENGVLSSNVLAEPFPIIVAPMNRLQADRATDGFFGRS